MKIVNKLFFILISMIFLSTIALAAPATDTNTVSGIIPRADFYIIPSSTIPLTINFMDQSTGSPISWSWNFGDETTSTNENPLHTYTTAGKYTVTLTVNYIIGTETRTVILTL
jgi:PKD repeat protein